MIVQGLFGRSGLFGLFGLLSALVQVSRFRVVCVYKRTQELSSKDTASQYAKFTHTVS